MATCSSILAWEIPWTEELLGVIKSWTQLRGYAHTHTYCKIVITIKFINKSITSHSFCWERPSAACRLSALISLQISAYIPGFGSQDMILDLL